MKTSDAILKSTIELYNKHGLNNVNSRNIAKKINKSHGNIEYHFKTKEIILLAIYKKMSKEITSFYEQKESNLNSFEKFDVLLRELELLQIKYGFFNLDIVEISRNFSSVNILLQKTLNKRKEQMRRFFHEFIKEGLVVENKDPEFYLRLQHTIRILITFWINQERILSSYNFKKQGEMAKHIWELLLPFMTPKGQDIYSKLHQTSAS